MINPSGFIRFGATCLFVYIRLTDAQCVFAKILRDDG